VEKERGRLANVVAVARDPREFFQVVDSFRDFASGCRAPVATAETPDRALRRVYRRVHTFKGLFMLFGCRRVSVALHDLESRLSALEASRVTAAALGDVVRLGPVQDELEADLALLRQTLGDDFFKRRDAVCIGEDVARELEGLAEGLAAALPAPAPAPAPDPRPRPLIHRAPTLAFVAPAAPHGLAPAACPVPCGDASALLCPVAPRELSEVMLALPSARPLGSATATPASLAEAVALPLVSSVGLTSSPGARAMLAPPAAGACSGTGFMSQGRR